MNTQNKKKLIIGIGNEGRGDDGLGWRFAERVENLSSPEYDVEYRHQLQVEDAELVSKYDYIIFADATVETLDKGFDFSACDLNCEYFFSSHTQNPVAVLRLANILFKKLPDAFVMRICGHEWDMGLGLSEAAQKNLENAFVFLEKIVSPHLRS